MSVHVWPFLRHWMLLSPIFSLAKHLLNRSRIASSAELSTNWTPSLYSILSILFTFYHSRWVNCTRSKTVISATFATTRSSRRVKSCAIRSLSTYLSNIVFRRREDAATHRSSARIIGEPKISSSWFVNRGEARSKLETHFSISVKTCSCSSMLDWRNLS